MYKVINSASREAKLKRVYPVQRVGEDQKAIERELRKLQFIRIHAGTPKSTSGNEGLKRNSKAPMVEDYVDSRQPNLNKWSAYIIDDKWNVRKHSFPSEPMYSNSYVISNVELDKKVNEALKEVRLILSKETQSSEEQEKISQKINSVRVFRGKCLNEIFDIYNAAVKKYSEMVDSLTITKRGDGYPIASAYGNGAIIDYITNGNNKFYKAIESGDSAVMKAAKIIAPKLLNKISEIAKEK